jgi:DNA-3-methyladenine glycosylase I
VTDHNRCQWVPADDPLYRDYHDLEWGVPVHDDRKLFECLTLESAQAGLSWITVLRKRENYRKAFADFDPVKVARFSEKRKLKLMQNAGIIRNRAKIDAAVSNAAAFLALAEKHGSFSDWIWRYVDGTPIRNRYRELADLPAKTDLSTRIARDLKKAGFKFLGPTTVYAHMQATGMVNDHTMDCFRYSEV